jgi:hypothetical protein
MPIKYFFACFLAFVLLLFLSPLEYDNAKYKIYIYSFFYVITAVVLIKWYWRRNSTIENILIPLAGIICLFASCNLLLDNSFCRWITYFDSYRKKTHKSVKLVCRSYECYGTDGNCELYKEWPITNHLKWVTKFNDKTVDTTIWESVNH